MKRLDTKILRALALLSEALDELSEHLSRIMSEIDRTRLRKDLPEEAKERLLKDLEEARSRGEDLMDAIHFAILLISKAYFGFWRRNFEAYPEILGLCEGGERG